MMKHVKYVLVATFEFVMWTLFCMPRYRWCNAIKGLFLRLFGAKVGRRVVFYPGVWIVSGRNLVLGDDVDLAMGVLITTAGGVSIGDRTLVGYRTQIFSANHTIPPVGLPFFSSGHEYKAVKIANDVWIGANCLILPGVEIAAGAVVAGGSVVTKNVAANTIVAGVPAKLLGQREPAEKKTLG